MGCIVGAKVRPLLSKMSSDDNMLEDKLKSFTVSFGHLFLGFLRPPLHPRLCIFFSVCVLCGGCSPKVESEEEFDGISPAIKVTNLFINLGGG